MIHGKNGFAEVFKNLAKYESENNFVIHSSWLLECHNFL